MNKKLCISLIVVFGIILIGSNIMTGFSTKPENRCVVSPGTLGVLSCLGQPIEGQHFKFSSVGFVCHADFVRVGSETVDVYIPDEDNKDNSSCPKIIQEFTYRDVPYRILPQN